VKAAPLLKVELPGALPGEASIGGGWSRAAVREAIEPWRRGLVDALEGEQLPSLVSATVTIAFPDRRKRNIANWRSVARRLLADALDQEVVELHVKQGRRRKSSSTKIVLEAAP